MKRKIYDLKNKRAGVIADAQNAIEARDMDLYNTKMGEIQNLNAEIQGLEALEAEKGKFEDADSSMVNLHDSIQNEKQEGIIRNAVDTARSGNEYARAWADAIKNGISIKNTPTEGYGALTNALTISGGTPAGSEGGFLVPIDFDNVIHLKMKEFIRLADYFKEENVSGYTGWRAIETAKANKPLPLVDEAKPMGENDKPSFEKVFYNVKKYGDIIPVSSELMLDNTAGLMQYLADWFGPKVVLTENALLLALLNGVTKSNLTVGREINDLKSALNRGLNTAHSKGAILLCNQTSYDFMDNLTDTTGRGLLVPDPTNPDVFRFKSRPIIMADDDLIPSRKVTTTGDTKGDYHPIYIGNMKAFGTLFKRSALEFASTNIGGNAWRTDTTEIRGIVRMDAQKVDGKAVTEREIFEPAS